MQCPADEEFVASFLRAEKGAALALQKLGVLKEKEAWSSKVSPERVKLVVDLYRYVKWKLASTNDHALLPDIIRFEHLLCKILRVIDGKLSVYTIFRP